MRPHLLLWSQLYCHLMRWHAADSFLVDKIFDKTALVWKEFKNTSVCVVWRNVIYFPPPFFFFYTNLLEGITVRLFLWHNFHFGTVPIPNVKTRLSASGNSSIKCLLGHDRYFCTFKKGEKFALDSRKGSRKVAKTHLTFTSNVGTWLLLKATLKFYFNFLFTFIFYLW